MSEIQTPHQEPIESSEVDNFADINRIQFEQAERDAAKRLIQQETPQPFSQETTGWGIGTLPVAPNSNSRSRLIKVGVTAALAGAFAGGAVVHAVDSAPAQPPTFSEETVPVAATDGASIFSIAESVPGHNTVDTRETVEYISSYPANIDVLKDGLQIGEQVEVPISINGVEASDE